MPLPRRTTAAHSPPRRPRARPGGHTFLPAFLPAFLLLPRHRKTILSWQAGRSPQVEALGAAAHPPARHEEYRARCGPGPYSALRQGRQRLVYAAGGQAWPRASGPPHQRQHPVRPARRRLHRSDSCGQYFGTDPARARLRLRVRRGRGSPASPPLPHALRRHAQLHARRGDQGEHARPLLHSAAQPAAAGPHVRLPQLRIRPAHPPTRPCAPLWALLAGSQPTWRCN